MHTNPSADADGEGRTGSHGLSQPTGERLQELCQGLLGFLGDEAPRQAADPAGPSYQLQIQADRILRPHLEAGLRELTEALRQDLLVRIGYVQQLERLAAEKDDSSLQPRSLQGQSPILSAPGIPESSSRPASGPNPLDVQDVPLHSPDTPEHSFKLEAASLQAEQTHSSEATTPTANFAALAPASSESAALEGKLRQAAELWRQSDKDQALGLCSQIIQENPAAVGAYLLRGQMLAQRGEDALAIADFTSVIALCPHHVKAYLRRSNLLLESGKLDQARNGFSIVVELQPDLAEAYLKRGLIHLRQQALREAIEDAGAVMRLQPDCGGAYFIRASASFQQGDWQRSLADLNHLLQREPNNALAYNERGLVLASRGEYAQALADYARALRLKPSLVAVRYNRALAFLQLGELDLALAAFTDLIQLAPDNAMAYYQRARVHQARQEFEQALADCKQSLKLEPRFQEAEACLRELQSVGRARRHESPPPTLTFNADTTAEKEAAPPPKKPNDGENPAKEAASPPKKPADDKNSANRPNDAPKEANPPTRRAATALGRVELKCEGCGATAQIGIDRLDGKYQCRQCGRIYFVRPDGKLTEVVRLQSSREQLRASVRKAVRLLPLAGLLLAVILGGWLGWRGLASARSPQPLPKELPPRAEILVKAWLNNDANGIQSLTTPAQEGRVDTWLRKHSFPKVAEELKASRSWIHQTKIEVRVVAEERDYAQLSIKVNTPVGPPIILEQEWLHIGPNWYFQPFPEPRKRDRPPAPRG